MDIGVEHSNWQFEWNQQKVNAKCICGEIVQVFSDGPTTCSCGRIYWTETKLKVDWATKGMGDEPLTEDEY